jgi:hypothetical protein
MFFWGQIVSFFDQKGENFFWLFLFPSLTITNFANLWDIYNAKKSLGN